MKKRIGIPGFKTGENFGVGLNHLEYASQFGDPIIIMPCQEFVPVDLLYLTGGLDVNPMSYGEIPGFKTSNQDVYKQFFFEHRLKTYVDKKIPVFGVCLGFQMLNVFFGGKLKQHSVFHPQSKDRMKEGHEVRIPGAKFKVNSHHHQLVIAEMLSKALEPLAFYDCEFDGQVIEAFKHNVLPIAAVQWHPEEWYDDFTKQLITKLLNSNKK